MNENTQALQTALEHLAEIKRRITTVIIGQDPVIDQILITLLAGGHALLEGVPGTAKTLTIRALALLLDCRGKRIQFTPDLMPSDIVGINTYNLKTNEFDLRQGPIFTDLLLADEINRAPAKTQSALLEGMSERHTTIDGIRYQLSPIFTVFATQNPIEFEGTYPLPEAQQDRFLLKIKIDYPPADAELRVLQAIDSGNPPEDLEAHEELKPSLNVDQLVAIRQQLHHVKIEPGVMDYILGLVRATREHEQLLMGAGPRGSIFLLTAAKAHSLINGRDFVTPDDVIAMIEPVLAHRVVMTAEAEISGDTVEGILRNILDKIEVPR